MYFHVLQDAIVNHKQVKSKNFQPYKHFFARLFTADKTGRSPHHLSQWNQKDHPRVAMEDGSIQLAAVALRDGVSGKTLYQRSRKSMDVSGEMDHPGPSTPVKGKGNEGEFAVTAAVESDIQLKVTGKTFSNFGTMTEEKFKSVYLEESVEVPVTQWKAVEVPNEKPRVTNLNFA